MSLNNVQIKQIKDKVLYSELDRPFNRYIDKVTEVNRLCHNILEGNIQSGKSEETETKDPEFSAKVVQDLATSIELRFIEVQTSIDSKKIAFENWQQENDKVRDDMEHNVEPVLSELSGIRDRLRSRISNLRTLYDNVNTINGEYDALSGGKTTLEVTREEWEKELGAEVTDKLIQLHYLKRGKSSARGDYYHVYDDFSKGPKEVKRLNINMKTDITKLGQELDTYKQKWLKDADVFSKITNVLQDELTHRDMDRSGDENMDENGDSDEEDEEQEARDERMERHVFLDEHSDDDISIASSADDVDVDGNENGEIEEEEEEEEEEDIVMDEDSKFGTPSNEDDNQIIISKMPEEEGDDDDDDDQHNTPADNEMVDDNVVSLDESVERQEVPGDMGQTPEDATPRSRTASFTDTPDDDNSME